MGRLIRGLAAGGQLRVLAADTTDVVEEARRRHNLSPTATAALGRALTGAALLTYLLSKTPKEQVTLKIEGDGPLGHLVAEAGVDGRVRGYVKNPEADVPISEKGKLDVGRLIGKGELRVMRSLPSGEIYDSSVPLVSGEIAEDLTYYLAKSEQIPSAVLLGVRVAPDGHVEAAGGMVVQVMPGADEAVLSKLEDNLNKIPGFSELLLKHGLEGAVEKVLEGLDFEKLKGEAVGLPDELPLAFKCRCNREKAKESLRFFKPEELKEMAEEGGAEVVCRWCGEVYRFSPEEVLKLIPEPPEAPLQG